MGHKSSSPILISLGNALLDISVPAVGACDLIQKYGLCPNGHTLVDEASEQKLLPLFDEVLRLDNVEMRAGGSVLNTIRVLQWMKGRNGDRSNRPVVFFGAVGDDQTAKLLEAKGCEVGVEMRLQTVVGKATGKCVCLVNGPERTFCAHLSAAQVFSADLLKTPTNVAAIESAEYFYTAAFFFAVSPAAIFQLAEHASSCGKTFIFNLSAAYVPAKFKRELNALLPHVDVLIGNDQECRAYAVANEFYECENVEEIAMKLAKIEKINKSRQRIVLVTRGHRPIVVATAGENQRILTFQVSPISSQELVDTNGAGDAFAGGFLAALIAGRPLPECVGAGCEAAKIVCQQSGCTLPVNL